MRRSWSVFPSPRVPPGLPRALALHASLLCPSPTKRAELLEPGLKKKNQNPSTFYQTKMLSEFLVVTVLGTVCLGGSGR